MTLIEAARTMLVDSLLPIPCWAEAFNTACYVQNRVLVTKPQNKTLYELLHGRTPSIGFMKPFGCPVTILNTLDSLGKFDGKVDEGFLVGYSVSSSSPTWMFDIDTLTKTMNYQPVTAGNQFNPSAGVQEQFAVEKVREESDQQFVLFPVWSSSSTNPQNTDGDAAFDEKEPEFEGMKPASEVNVSSSSSAQSKKYDDKTKREAKGKSPIESLTGYRNLSVKFEDFSANSINEVNATGTLVPAVGQLFPKSTNTFSVAGPSNAASLTDGKSLCIDTSQFPDDSNMPELEDITYSDDEDDVGTEADFNNLETSIIVSPIRTTRVHKDHHVTQIIGDLSLATQIRSMTRVAKDQGRIEAIRLFLAYDSFMGFMLYQMDVKSAFLYGTIKEEVYVCQPLGFEDPDHPDKVYKVVKALYGLHQAPRAWYETLANYLLENVKQKKDGIVISQDKYVAEILRKFGLIDGKSASTPIDIEKPLLKDLDSEDVDMHIYRSMIGSLMYLTLSRPDIMFVVCTCACFQVTPKASHLHVVKRIFRYLKGKPHLGLWYPKDSPFNLVSYSDSDYAGARLDRKSTTGGCQFLRCRLISWQCKKQTFVTTLSTEAEYVAAAKAYCCMFIDEKVSAEVGEDADEVHAKDVNASGVVAEGTASDDDAGVSMNLFQNLMDICTTLTRRVKPLELDKITQALEITMLKQRVKKLKRRNKLKVLKLRRLKRVGSTQRIDTSDDTVIDDISKQGGIIANIDADKDVVLEDAKDVAADAKDGQDDDIDKSVDIQGWKTESQAQIYQIDLEHANKVLSMQDDKGEPAELQEVVDTVTTTKIITEVVTAASTTLTATTLQLTTAAALTLTTAPSAVGRRKGVVIRDPQETATPFTIIHSEAKSKDKGKGIFVEEPKPLKKQAQIEQDKAYAMELEAELNKSIDWDEVIDHMDYFKGMTYDDIRPIFKKYFNSNVAFLQKTKDQMDEEDNRALKRMNESQEEKIITYITTHLILLVERRNPLIRFTLDQTLNNVRLEVEEESKVSLELLSFGVDAAVDFKENMLSV
uniref:Reverse transcriptase Ty1/copia-type domain-containing protein n=1 Tax=Tanacetum cinerariifolium TaxID=118510 RepID=A0A6L2J3L8_TANCI|nr:hypothetical protein [Tanacetum cinerariifolium]